MTKLMTAEETLEVLGFKNEWNIEDQIISHPHGEYFNEEGTKQICLKGDGIYAYSVDRGSVYGAPYLEMHLNFIPESILLAQLIKQVFYL